MKYRNILKGVAAMFLCAAVMSCSKDEAKPDEPEVPAAQNQTVFDGIIASSVPSVPSFPAVQEEATATLEWTNDLKTKANVKFTAFKISIANMPAPIEMGEIEIDDVTLAYDQNGVATIAEQPFEVMAGVYETKGTIEGSYATATGDLELTMVYRPGSMPMNVKSVFTGTRR